MLSDPAALGVGLPPVDGMDIFGSDDSPQSAAAAAAAAAFDFAPRCQWTPLQVRTHMWSRVSQSVHCERLPPRLRYILGTDKVSPRTEIVLDHHMFTNASAVSPNGGTCKGQVSTHLPA